MSNVEKLKALKLTMDKIDKDFGKGSVMMMNEKTHQSNRELFQPVLLAWMWHWGSADCRKEG